MQLLAALLVVAVNATAGENLLANPSFEELRGVQPARWNLFVEPAAGAWGRLDTSVAADGKCSVCLHTARPYAVEPANNWSQNIIAKLQGVKLTVRGKIRTEDATEAAIWLQCFRRTPFAILKTVSTSDTMPMYGTRDWTEVEADIEVPAGTDFVVCRCVLKGTGTAWFDDLSVVKAPMVSRKGLGVGVVRKVKVTAPIRPPVAVSTPVSRPRAAPPQATSVRAGGEQETSLEALRRAHQELVESNRELRDTNRAMETEIKQLKTELDALRREIARNAPKPIPAPPLVPHGYKLETAP